MPIENDTLSTNSSDPEALESSKVSSEELILRGNQVNRQLADILDRVNGISKRLLGESDTTTEEKDKEEESGLLEYLLAHQTMHFNQIEDIQSAIRRIESFI